MNFSDYLKAQQIRSQQTLENFLPSADSEPQCLHEAMRYAVLNGGKRIRPLLVYASGEIFNADKEILNHAAAAVEMIHCYSLVHDDLPAMDNDDLRRGKPTCHKAYDEATAILVGDALQALAFETLTKCSANLNIQLKMLQILTQAAGSRGMTGGQAIDLAAIGKKLNLTQLENLHSLKTGALIAASVQLGALAGNCKQNEMNALTEFANKIGLAFQIQDDILDVESSTEKMGKKKGADIALNKPTFASILGLAAAKEYLNKTYQAAIKYLDFFGNKAQPLVELASYIVKRNS